MGFHRKSNREVHYEVHCRDGANWIILDLFQDKDRALATAEKAWKQQKCKAIRVIRETFSPKSSTFETMELAYHGRKFKPGTEDEGSTVPCHAPADLYSAEGRRTIGSLLSETLINWQITPTELLHCPKHYYRLEGTGTMLQAAVQKAAVAQSKGGGVTIQERIKQLYALLGRASIRLRGEWDQKKVAEIVNEDIAPLIDRLADGGEDRMFLFAASLSRDLLAVEGAVAKITRLLDLMQASHPEWALRVFDSLISELIVLPGITSNIAADANGEGSADGTGDQGQGASGLAEMLVNIARLARGAIGQPTTEASAGEDGHEDQGLPAELSDGKRLAEFLKEAHLPQTRRALLGVIARKLTSSQRLAEGALDQELEALTSVRLSLEGAEEELLGRGTLIDALEDRCRRFLNPQFVAEYLQDVTGPQDGLKKLMTLEHHCIGLQNKRRIANHILPLLQSGNSEIYFTSSKGNPLDRMRYLAKLQGAIMASGMTEQHKEHMVERLDQLCHMTMTNAHLLELLEKRTKDPTEAAKRLLAMIAGECFSEGAAKSAAIERLESYFADPKLTALLATQPDDPEQVTIRGTILSLAARAGIDLPI